MDMVYTGGAVIAAPFIENQIRPLLPASLTGNTAGRYAVRVGSAALTWYAWKSIFGRKYGELAALVLGANILSDAAQEFIPSLTAGMSGVRGVRGIRGMSGVSSLTGGMGQATGRPVRQLGQATGYPVNTLAPFQSRFSPRFGTRMG